MLTEKVANFFECSICDYNTSRKSSYTKHILSSKHLKLTNVNKTLTENCEKVANEVIFTCQKCCKIYKSRVGLWKHKKSCTEENSDTNINNPLELTQETILAILKQNSEFQQMLLDQSKTMMELAKNSSITNNNTNNSHNKTFNLNLFLNETCKNAMNINDFVDSLQLQLSDLEKVGEVGYIEGISNIIIKNLNAMDVTLRPVHCTDKKRETMYIKDEDKWEKEDVNKVKMHKMVRKVANKNIHLIQDFKDKYPDCIRSTSRHSDKYNKIIVESMGGTGDNEYEKEEKIIKKIAKEVVIDKEASNNL
jgi:dGTP triphosphohydrolase